MKYVLYSILTNQTSKELCHWIDPVCAHDCMN